MPEFLRGAMTGESGADDTPVPVVLGRRELAGLVQRANTLLCRRTGSAAADRRLAAALDAAARAEPSVDPRRFL
jgi:hypothetical protein